MKLLSLLMIVLFGLNAQAAHRSNDRKVTLLKNAIINDDRLNSFLLENEIQVLGVSVKNSYHPADLFQELTMNQRHKYDLDKAIFGLSHGDQKITVTCIIYTREDAAKEIVNTQDCESNPKIEALEYEISRIHHEEAI